MSDQTALILDMLAYDAETGRITWQNVQRQSRVQVGDEAGGFDKEGYRRIQIAGCKLQAHRIAWLLHYGEWPAGMIDHVNGDPSDNRIGNLRIATNRQNQGNRRVQANNTTGFKGVSRDKRHNTYRARIRVNGLSTNLGSFPTAEVAHEAYRVTAEKHFGEFALGRCCVAYRG